MHVRFLGGKETVRFLTYPIEKNGNLQKKENDIKNKMLCIASYFFLFEKNIKNY